jgi:hypothetical protein
MSGGLAAHLSRHCSTALRSDPVRATGIINATVNYFWRFVATAGAQYPPANYRANNPNGPPSADFYPFITQNEVSIAASHVNSDVMIAAYNDTSHINLGSGVGYARTQNRGATWIDMGLVSPPDFNHQVTSDPVVAAHPNGLFYIAHIVQKNDPLAYFIGVKRSFDGGQTFGPTANASPTSLVNMQDKPDIAVDRTFTSQYYGRVYVCWFDLGAGGIRFSRSLDGGATFTQLPNAISSDVNSNVNGCSIAVGRQGHVWVAWWNRYIAPKSIYIARSTNGGESFEPQVVIAQAPYVVPPPISLDNLCQAIPFLNGFVGVKFWGNIAADPLVDNNVYAVWQSWDETLQSSEIYFSASTHGGEAATWSTPVRINDVTTGDQFFPRIATNVFHASSPDKTQIKVIWYDRRLDPQNLSVHVFGDASFNAGAAWQNDVRWSTTASPLPHILTNFDCRWGGPCYFGDYNGLSTMGPGSDLFVAAWGDTRPPLASGTPCNTCPSPQPDPNVMTAVGC